MDEQALATAIAETRAFWLEQEARECDEDRAWEARRHWPSDGFGRMPALGELVEVTEDG